jgi:hypothetical protein
MHKGPLVGETPPRRFTASRTPPEGGSNKHHPALAIATDTGRFEGLSAGAAPKACRRMSEKRGPQATPSFDKLRMTFDKLWMTIGGLRMTIENLRMPPLAVSYQKQFRSISPK